MPFTKGQEKKGGRKRGTTNLATAKLKSMITDLVNDEMEKVTTELSKLEGKDYLLVIKSFAQLVVPKTNEILVDDLTGQGIEWEKIPLKERKKMLAVVKSVEDEKD